MPGATSGMKVLVRSVSIMGAIEAMCSAANVHSTVEIEEFSIMEVMPDKTYITRADKIVTPKGSGKIITYVGDSSCITACTTPEGPAEEVVSVEKYFNPPRYEVAA